VRRRTRYLQPDFTLKASDTKGISHKVAVTPAFTQFADNNAPHSSTDVSTFLATRGYEPLIAVQPDADVTGLRAPHFAINFNEVHRFLRDRMKDAQDVMSRYANQRSHRARSVSHWRSRIRACGPHMDELGRPQARGEKDPPLSHHFSTIRHVFYPTPTVHYPHTSWFLHVSIEDTFEDRNQQPPLIVDGQPEDLIERIKDSNTIGFAANASHGTTSNGSAIPYPTIPPTGSSRTLLTTLQDNSPPQRIAHNLPTSLVWRN